MRPSISRSARWFDMSWRRHVLLFARAASFFLSLVFHFFELKIPEISLRVPSQVTSIYLWLLFKSSSKILRILFGYLEDITLTKCAKKTVYKVGPGFSSFTFYFFTRVHRRDLAEFYRMSSQSRSFQWNGPSSATSSPPWQLSCAANASWLPITCLWVMVIDRWEWVRGPPQ